MNDNHKFWQAGNMQIDEMEAAEGKIPHVNSCEVETIALPVDALQGGKDSMEISQAVKDKLGEVVQIWADEVLEGKPAILGYAIYSNLVTFLQSKTDEINEKFAE